MTRARKPLSRTVALILVTAVLGGTALAAGNEKNAGADGKAAAQSINAFATDLYARLSPQKGNLFFSPFSISTALAMTSAGARGETLAQMRRVLHFTLDEAQVHRAFARLLATTRPDEGCELAVANALWGQRGEKFLPMFLKLLEADYTAPLHEVDFKTDCEGARQTINAWVERETRDKIKDLIQPGVLDAATRLVLTNAIYFKGVWAAPFKEDHTRDAPFTLAGGDRVTVPMMSRTSEFPYMEGATFQVLALPYAGDDLAMVVLLPKETGGLSGLEERLTAERLAEWLGQMRPRKVSVALPRFKVTSSFSLADVLKAMGMTDAFSTDADFSGMTGAKDLFLSAVIHKAFVDVNEQGTEAAAATAAVMNLTAAMPQPVPVFRADHPFLFLIRDRRTGAVLFMGRVADPKP